MQRFLKSQRGYVLVLTLLFMPIFIGIGLLVIDISRASNAQQDHQAAADALPVQPGPKPAYDWGSNTLDIEIVDLYNSRAEIDTLFRYEPLLVR